MHVANLAGLEIHRGIKEAVIGAFFDQPGDEGQIAAQFLERGHFG